MNYIKLAKVQLLQHEGYRKYPYKDTEGILTIGIGRNLEDRGITLDEAMYLLENDIEIAVEELENNFKWFKSLNDTRKIVLIDMMVNLGISRLKKFKKMLRAIEENNFEGAATEMMDSKWANQVGNRAEKLSVMMATGH